MRVIIFNDVKIITSNINIILLKSISILIFLTILIMNSKNNNTEKYIFRIEHPK